MNYFVKGNPDLCMGCRTCLIACVVAHGDEHIFEIDPNGYTFNPKLHMVKTRKITVPVQCKHCESPACLAVCPENAITIKDHAVIINEAKCVGCKSCMDACPFGAIDMVTVAGKFQADGEECVVANKCDLCQGVEGGPACVRVCPTEALKVVCEEEIVEKCASKRLASANTLYMLGNR